MVETGSIFVQIGDENVHLARTVMDEVFGRENFVSLIAFVKSTGATNDYLSNVADYLIWYGKSAADGRMKYRQLYLEKLAGESNGTNYNRVRITGVGSFSINSAYQGKSVADFSGSRIYSFDNLTSQSADVKRVRAQYPVLS